MATFQSDRGPVRQRTPRFNVNVVGNIPPDADIGVLVPGSPEEGGFTGFDLPPARLGVAESESPQVLPDCVIADRHAGE